MKKITLLLLLTLSLFAGKLQLKEGFVAAHTEVLGDSTIDPLNNNLNADLTISDNDITSIKGELSVDMKLFLSDNSDRDENMNETTEVDKFPLASYTITDISKTNDMNAYTITGTLDFHGVQREVNFSAEIVADKGTITISAISKILLSDYVVDAPCLLGFALCVEDKVDIFAKAVLIK